MATETMSITRGLREIRLLKDRIEKTIISTKFAAGVVGVNFIDGKSQDAYASEVLAYAASIDTMIRRRDALKQAIVLSNAQTQVSIGDVSMTVAEAIERKGSIEHEKSLLLKLVQDWSLANNAYQRMAMEAKTRRDHMLSTLLQDGVRSTDAEYRAATEAFDSDVMNMPIIVDPLNIRDRIDKLRERIENFENEVDVVLSESNGHTQITVEY